MTERRRTREELKRELEAQKKKNQKPVKVWLKRIFLTIVIIGVIGFLTGVGVFAYYASTAPKLDESTLKDPISSEFYDINGDLFATIGTESRKYTTFDEIPEGLGRLERHEVTGRLVANLENN